MEAESAASPAVTFGLFDWVDADGVRDPGQLYAERLDLLAEAERLCPLVYVLPLYDPTRLAEEIAMLDHLSAGRLEIGFGKGGNPYELLPYGIEAGDAQAAIPRAFLGLGRWASTPFSGSASDRRQPGDPAPRDEYFDGVAGRAGDRDGRRRASTPRFGMMRNVYVGESDDAARQRVVEAMDVFYRQFTAVWRRHDDASFEPTQDFGRAIEEGRRIAGSAATVRRRCQPAAGFRLQPLRRRIRVRIAELRRGARVAPAIRHGGRTGAARPGRRLTARSHIALDCLQSCRRFTTMRLVLHLSRELRMSASAEEVTGPLLVISAHAGDFVWRAGGAMALAAPAARRSRCSA